MYRTNFVNDVAKEAQNENQLRLRASVDAINTQKELPAEGFQAKKKKRPYSVARVINGRTEDAKNIHARGLAQCLNTVRLRHRRAYACMWLDRP
jgi:hypothetical protein